MALLISEMKRPVLAKFSIRGVLISDLLIIESAAVKKKNEVRVDFTNKCET